MEPVALPLWIGFAIMSIASVALYLHGDKRMALRHHTQFHSLVPFIAATSYLAMALGIGRVEINEGETLFLARYMDWAVTTPVLLTGLILVGLHEHPRHSTFILPAIVLDVIMIVTGLVAALVEPGVARWAWYAWSCAAFLGIVFILLGPVRGHAKARGGRMYDIYVKNLGFLLAVWFLYPIEWLLGPQGIRVFDAVLDAWIILVLDVTAKVVYGYVVTARLKKLSDAEAG